MYKSTKKRKNLEINNLHVRCDTYIEKRSKTKLKVPNMLLLLENNKLNAP